MKSASLSSQSRACLSVLVFILVAHIAFLLPQTREITQVTQSYPATACPGPVSDAKATALLPNKKTAVRDVAIPKSQLRKNNQGSYSIQNGAILVEGNISNTIALESRKLKWTAATTCTISDSTQWFVGGTGNVTSQSKLVLVNSGLSDAIVDISSFSENGPTRNLPVTVRASSEKVLRIDTLDPGATSMVIKVNTRSGRVTAFLLDERVRGLNNVGGDFVTPVNKASRETIISALPMTFGKGSKITHKLRLVTTGKVDAIVNVEVISPEGVFVPVGLGSISLRSQVVRDIKLPELNLGKKTFALKIVATQPVVAGVFTEVKKGQISDFMWSSGVSPFGKVSFNLYGLEPQFSFVGDRIQVEVLWQSKSGKKNSKLLVGDEIVNWVAPANVRLITFLNRSGAVGAMSWITQDGITHLPISASTNVESATKPIADVTVIQVGKQ